MKTKTKTKNEKPKTKAKMTFDSKDCGEHKLTEVPDLNALLIVSTVGRPGMAVGPSDDRPTAIRRPSEDDRPTTVRRPSDENFPSDVAGPFLQGFYVTINFSTPDEGYKVDAPRWLFE